MTGYDFEKPIDTDNPLDPLDLPPKGHEDVDTSDFRRALFGHSEIIRRCQEWEEREMERHGYKLILKETMPRVYRRTFEKSGAQPA